MSESHRYNGWTNYETWVAALWIDNDEYNESQAREIVAENWDADATWGAADALKEWAEGEFIDPVLEGSHSASLAADLLRAAFGEVDWFEIAESYKPEEDEDEEARVGA